MIFLSKEDDIGKRLDVFLAERANITRSASQKYIEAGQVTVNGKLQGKNYKILAGDEVDYTAPPVVSDRAEAQDIPIEIVYEDDDLAVVMKPKGMVVHPAAGNHDGTLVNALLYKMGASLSGINGVVRPGIVHRIDKDTSGLLIVAKNDFSHVALAAQIKVHSFTRKYYALVVGNMREECGKVDAPIARNPRDRKKMAIVQGGRDAVTHWKVIERFHGFTLVECTLETGRTHQIRVHLSSLGHPVAGDSVYGGGKSDFEKKNQSLFGGQCLHAKYISFEHPRTHETLSFDSPLPEYFETILQKLRKAQ